MHRLRCRHLPGGKRQLELQILCCRHVLTWHYRPVCELRGRDVRVRFGHDELCFLCSRHILLRWLQRMCELRCRHLQKHDGRYTVCRLRSWEVCVHDRVDKLPDVRGGDILGGRRERMLSLCS